MTRETFVVCSHVTSLNQSPFSRVEERGPLEESSFRPGAEEDVIVYGQLVEFAN